MAPTPKCEVGHFKRGPGWVQVHHPHNPPEEVAGSVQHDACEQRDPCRVADEKEGNVSLDVEEEHRGQDDHCDRSLEQFEPGHGSQELNVWQGVNHCVLLHGQIRVPGQGGDYRKRGSVEALLSGGMNLHPIIDPTCE